MIRVMTLDAAAQTGTSPDHLLGEIDPLGMKGIDVLCCQSIRHDREGNEHSRTDLSRLLADTLGLTYSCYVAGRHPRRRAEEGESVGNGLAILTGTGVWILNSGSFSVGEEEDREIVQFALIRKNGASALVLNLHLAAAQQAQEAQLRDLFLHPLLKDQYGAVVLCADRPATLAAKEWHNIVARSNYSLQRSLLAAAPNEGLLCLLTARADAVSVVTVRHPGPDQLSEVALSATVPGLTMEFEVKRMVSEKRSRPYFPLSFREQWLGYKEHRAFA